MPPDLAFVTHRLRPYLTGLLTDELAAWKEQGAPWWDAPRSLVDYLDGGKALRPRFCYWGHLASRGLPDNDALLTACAALELLHGFALIHDDLMDASSTRRGRPALHRDLADEHRRHGWAGPADQYGTAGALLTGDLAFALASRLAADLPAPTRPVWNQLITELTCGQFLDLAGSARRDRSVELARTVARLKSGRYTVTGPMRLGAALTGVVLDPTLARFADLVGEAFQLRDDLLGLFGDADVTGKPVGDDLRSGKPTLLVAHAARYAPAGRRALLDRIGAVDLTDTEVGALTDLIDSCGARARVERRVTRHIDTARALLRDAGLPAPTHDALDQLAAAATQRSR